MTEYVLTLLLTAAVTYLLTPLVRRIAIRAGAAFPARDRDVHAAPIPRMGGIAMYLGVAAGLLVALDVAPLRSLFPSNGPVNGIVGLFLAGGLIVLLGIVDDRWGMNAIGKMLGQIAAAGILVASGASIPNFPEPNDNLFSLTQNESVVLTILVVVATINAVNFIDGLDGLAAGIVCIAAISFFLYYYDLTQVVGLQAESVPALVSVLLAGACIGFLPHNFYPAKIFMGDTGSMLLGLLLAYVPISAISTLDYSNLGSKANRFPEILPLLLPAAVLVIPYVDMLRAVVRRTRAGLSPFAADMKHLHHRMLEIGHSHRSSVLIMYAWAALFAGAVVGLSIVTAPLLVLAGTTLAAVLALALLSMPKLRWWERNRAAGPVRPAPVPERATAAGLPVMADAGTEAAGTFPPPDGAMAARYIARADADDDFFRPSDHGGPAPDLYRRSERGGSAPDLYRPSERGGPAPDLYQRSDPDGEAARDWFRRSDPDGDAVRDLPGSDGLFRPVEPAPVHPLDATAPMPIARASGNVIP